jgi:hypothetical protein
LPQNGGKIFQGKNKNNHQKAGNVRGVRATTANEEKQYYIF